MNSWLKSIQFILFPGTCVLCGTKGQDELDLCSNCLENLPFNSSTCRQCALPLPAGSTGLCGQCVQNPPQFQRSYALWQYASPIDYWISQLKFQQKLQYARLMGRLCANEIAQAYGNKNNLPDIVVPVPLHKTRLRQRGFNQAVEIARPIGEKLNIPLDTKSCVRTKATEPQSSLSAKARHRNIKGAFQVVKEITAGHVAIVDDVMTTGQTINELALVLRLAHVKQIDVWLCARASK